MKFYDLITKRGNTYRIDETNYQSIMMSISQGKMFVMAGDVPINVNNIAEIPKSKTFNSIDTHHQIEPVKITFNPDAPGYKKFLRMRDKLIRKKVI